MIHTLGHSTRPEKDFIELLRHYHIEVLADIRTMPRSRWNPQFNRTALERSVTSAGMKYMHIPELGGLREAKRGSVNLALKADGFRGYADHMQTPEFEQALLNIIRLSRKQKVALMCAEASFEKCHRRFTSDALMVRKVKVLHVLGKDECVPHVLHEAALVEGTKITYPLSQSRLEF